MKLLISILDRMLLTAYLANSNRFFASWKHMIV